MVYLRRRTEEKGGTSMTEQLRQPIERLQKLPIEEQNAIAERILDELDEREWERITSTSHVQQAIIELADEAEQHTKQFHKRYAQQPSHVQAQARAAYQQFKDNPQHPI